MKVKRLIDIVVSATLLVAVSPVLVSIAALVAIRDKQPPFFGHWRLGRNFQEFRCWKFRTMTSRTLTEEELAEFLRAYKLENDPRVTTLGRFLRKTKLDELPQLLNVLRGEMSLVGPRPIVKGELSRYGESIQDVLSIRPGMTGLFQVLDPHNKKAYWERVDIDLYYVDNQSLSLDLVIAIETILLVVKQK